MPQLANVPPPERLPSPILRAALVTRREAATLYGVSIPTFDRMRTADRVPNPVHPSPGCVRWRAQDILDHIAAGCPPAQDGRVRRWRMTHHSLTNRPVTAFQTSVNVGRPARGRFTAFCEGVS